MTNLTNRTTCLMMSLLLLATLCNVAVGKMIYVDDDAIGANDGSSWENAYFYLQDALADANFAEKPVEIRVAQGIYKPDQGAIQTPGSREATFRLINDVTLEGGYAGLGEIEPNTRDVELYETILSGDLNDDDVQVDVEEVADINDLKSEPTRMENSYNVVTGIGTDDSAILNGFTITAGNANGSYDYRLPTTPDDDWWRVNSGAGMFNIFGSPVVANCTFIKNSADEGGGMFNYDCNLTLNNCRFIGNPAYLGGGIQNFSTTVTLTNCTFTGNSANKNGGGMFNYDCNLTLTECTFKRNSTQWSGGGLYNWFGTVSTLTNCTFIGNTSMNGGALRDEGDSSILTNCSFIANEASHYGGGMCTAVSKLTNCSFIANKARDCGGGIYSFSVSLDVTNCLFNANSAEIGGGVYNLGLTEGAEIILTNCTLSGNSAQSGNALACHNMFGYLFMSNLKLKNCIIWGSNNEIWNDDGSSITISYSNIQGGQAGIYDPHSGIVWGQGNIDLDPLFADPGHWVDVNDPNNALWINGDYHLKSQAGRWDPVSESWVVDDTTSPCIDAGDPLTPVMYEPHPRGCFINMGAYGGTEKASKSPFNSPY